MKRNVLHLLLILAVPASLYVGAVAQDRDGDADRTGSDASTIESREDEKTSTTSDKNLAPSDRNSTTSEDKRNDTEAAAESTAHEVQKKTDRKKKEARKQVQRTAEKTERAQEDKTKEEVPADIDTESGDDLLLIDHEQIKYNRIPGITIKTEEPEHESIVKIPDDKFSDPSAKKKSEGGIFGKNTRAIAGWGIIILIFIIFAIYSRTRSRKSKRKVVRTVPKR